MPYGSLKVDNIIFTNGGVDQTITVSGIVASTSGNLTVTGTISGNIIRGGTTVSGATVTGAVGQFGNLTAVSGTFTTISGGTYTLTSGVFASGTAANPSISFVSDPNTGIYSPAADTLAFVEGGVEAMRIDSSGRLLVGTTAAFGQGGLSVLPSYSQGAATLGFNRANTTNTSIPTYFQNNDSNVGWIQYSNNTVGIFGAGGSSVVLGANGGEAARIDTSGRLLVGTSSARSNFFNFSGISPALQLEGTSFQGRALSIVSSDNSSAPASAALILARQMSGSVGGNTIVSDGLSLGLLSYQGSDGTEFVEAARIEAFVDGTPGANDMPGRLVFSTTADGASTPTERMRLDSSGRLGLGTSSPSNTAGFSQQLEVAGNLPCVSISNTGTGANKYSLGVNGVGALGIWDNTASAFRMYINSSGQVGIGSTTPQAPLHLNATGSAGSPLEMLRIQNSATEAAGVSAGIRFIGANNWLGGIQARFQDGSGNTSLLFETAAGGSINERARIDSSGRLLVGTSTSRQVNASIAALQLQIEGTNYSTSSMSLVTNQNAADGSYIVLGKSRGASLNSSTIVNSGDSLGAFWFCGADGTDLKRGAVIEAQVAGTPGANDMPGRLVFSTTADGASSPTERMRIGPTGNVGIANTSLSGQLSVGTTPVGFNAGTFSSPVRGNIFYDTDGSGWQLRIGKLQSGTFSSQMVFIDDNTILVGRTSATSGGGVLQLSAGITFPATEVLSSDPNTLDDYEEGTWTPTLGGTTTYATREARYTKIGRVVHVSFYITVSGIGTGNTTTISGLPFTPLADTGGSSLSYWTAVSSSVCTLVGYIYGGATGIYLYSNTAASTGLVSNSIMTNGTTVQGHLSYFAA